MEQEQWDIINIGSITPKHQRDDRRKKTGRGKQQGQADIAGLSPQRRLLA
jgi:hypothetical protein